MATPLANLQAAYAAVCAQIAEAEGQPVGPNVSVGGVSVDRVGHLNSLYDRRDKLGKIPGVAPDQNPVFTVYG